MWKAYSRAAAKVSPSPRPTANPRSESTARPTVASATATHMAPGSRSRRSSAPRIGVKTTYAPVTNPETDAEVCSKPMVCRIWAQP